MIALLLRARLLLFAATLAALALLLTFGEDVRYDEQNASGDQATLSNIASSFRTKDLVVAADGIRVCRLNIQPPISY